MPELAIGQVPAANTKAPVQGNTTSILQALNLVRSDSAQRVSMRAPLAGGQTISGQRDSFIITSSLWLGDFATSETEAVRATFSTSIEPRVGKGILLHSGPKSAQWSHPRRSSEEDIATGKVRYEQARIPSGPVFMDNQKINFSFQGGNTLPIYDAQNLQVAGITVIQNRPSPIGIAPGLADYYRFLELVNQPTRLASGQPNYVWIFYNSIKFPQLLLMGYFDSAGHNMTDDADDPLALNWDVGFTVYESTPNLWSEDELMQSYNNVYNITG